MRNCVYDEAHAIRRRPWMCSWHCCAYGVCARRSSMRLNPNWQPASVPCSSASQSTEFLDGIRAVYSVQPLDISVCTYARYTSIGYMRTDVKTTRVRTAYIHAVQYIHTKYVLRTLYLHFKFMVNPPAVICADLVTCRKVLSFLSDFRVIIVG